jgi:hypothetical protein
MWAGAGILGVDLRVPKTCASWARTLESTIADPEDQARALASVARELANAWRHDRALELARSIPDIVRQIDTLVDIAATIVQSGDNAPAIRLATEAEVVARTLVNPYRHNQARRPIAIALERTGNHDDAEDIAHDIDDPFEQALAPAELALIMNEAGDHQRARYLASTPGPLAREISISSNRAQEHADLAIWLAQLGEHADAKVIARAITNDLPEKVRALTGVAAVVGNGEHGRELAAEAEDIARTISFPPGQATAL